MSLQHLARRTQPDAPVRVLARWLGVVLLYVLLFAGGAALFVAGALPPVEPAPDTSQADLFALLAMAAIDTLLFAVFARRSTLSGWRLWAALAFVFYGVKTFTSQLEAWVFMAGVDASLVPRLLAMTVPLSLLWPAALVRAFGGDTSRQTGEAGRPELSTGALLARSVVLAGVVYPALFFGFGYYVAWQSPELRAFYGGPAAAPGFVPHMAATLGASPWLLPFEMLRGALWIAFALPVLWGTRGAWWQRGLLVAAILALVQNDVHFLHNALMPATVRWWHFWETSSSNALWGLCIAFALARPERRR